MESKQIKIFTDGAARGNPGPGGWGAIVIYSDARTNADWTQTNADRIRIRELGGRNNHTTNNRMELTAVIKALEFARSTLHASRFTIYTDSSYALKGATQWTKEWQKNKWKTKQKVGVLNQDLWKKYLKASKDLNIEWKLLPGHSGIPANDRCDQIATAFADGHKPKLYSGFLRDYDIDISITFGRKRSTLHASRSTKPAYSYVSMVNGIIKAHKTWLECEKRVKGVSKARFKKTISLEDEDMIISDFKNSIRMP